MGGGGLLARRPTGPAWLHPSSLTPLTFTVVQAAGSVRPEEPDGWLGCQRLP
jgi:hypothetical protein